MTGIAEIRLAPAALGSLHDRAAAASEALVWVLDPSATPEDGALDALREHAPTPAASMPVDAAGRAVTPLLGRVEEGDQEAILEAVRRRSLPLRHIHPTSLLVERELVLDLVPPDPARFGWYAGSEWTARLFTRCGGVLVPGSRVRVDGASTGSPADLLRAARSAGWRRGETVRELHRSIKSSLR